MACLLLLLVAAGCAAEGESAEERAPSRAPLPFNPRTYVSYRTADPLQIDGTLNEAAWHEAAWTTPFVDIVGPSKPAPRFRTRAKMLWNDTYFYVAVTLEEPDVWATLTQRDTVIFYDNDFEVFIDPDGDTHAYYELEINALETIWDLMLLTPYRDGGPAIDGWDIRGLKAGVQINGTLNRPGDTDSSWTVELALPWSMLEEAASHDGPPRDGEQWRVNFSRVQWQTVVDEGRYKKKTDPATGEPMAEDNWVWSPQGVVNMHLPERWGYVQFSKVVAGEGDEAFAPDPNERVKWALRTLYYSQRRYREANGRYASRLNALKAGTISVEGLPFEPAMETTQTLYEITAPGFDGATLHIRQDSKTWVTAN